MLSRRLTTKPFDYVFEQINVVVIDRSGLVFYSVYLIMIAKCVIVWTFDTVDYPCEQKF